MIDDLLTLSAIGCWTFLTIGGSRLMTRHSPLYVSGVITTTSTQPDAAAALLRFLTSPAAAPVISKAGLTPVPSP